MKNVFLILDADIGYLISISEISTSIGGKNDRVSSCIFIREASILQLLMSFVEEIKWVKRTESLSVRQLIR